MDPSGRAWDEDTIPEEFSQVYIVFGGGAARFERSNRQTACNVRYLSTIRELKFFPLSPLPSHPTDALQSIMRLMRRAALKLLRHE